MIHFIKFAGLIFIYFLDIDLPNQKNDNLKKNCFGSISLKCFLHMPLVAVLNMSPKMSRTFNAVNSKMIRKICL